MVSLVAIFAVSRPILLYHNFICLSITYTDFLKINLLIRDTLAPARGWAPANKVEVNHAPPAPVPSGARVVRHRRPRGLHPCGGRRRRAEGAEHPEAAGVAGAGGRPRRGRGVGRGRPSATYRKQSGVGAGAAEDTPPTSSGAAELSPIKFCRV